LLACIAIAIFVTGQAGCNPSKVVKTPGPAEVKTEPITFPELGPSHLAARE
jgi:hypothetical protein